MKKFVFPENRSVNDLSVIGGTSGDDAIEPGAPPVCGVPGVPGLLFCSNLRRLLFFLDVIIITIMRIYYYNIRDSISNLLFEPPPKRVFQFTHSLTRPFFKFLADFKPLWCL